MTGRANSLTKGVTAGSQAEYRWSMPGNDVRAFMQAFDRLGYDAAALLASAGVHDRDLNDPDARIPCEALGTIVASAQRQRFTANIGLELARVTPLGANALLDYLVATSDTVGAGVRQLARYLRLVGNPVVLDVHDGNPDDIRIQAASGAAPFSVEYVLSLTVLHLRAETDGQFAATSLNFQHTPDDVLGFGRILGCEVRPTSSWNGLRVTSDAWRLPLRRRDPVLRHLLETHADDILSRLPRRTGLALEVQRALASTAVGGDTRVGTFARQLGMSGRTLQRRLAAGGVSYQQLLDEVRKEAAERYINEPTLAICEIAYMLGYSEPAPFHRAFKRWYGMTPDVFRRERRDGRTSVPG